MGYAAGHRVTANGNVLIGYLAGDNITTGASNTGVGTNVAFDIDADNQIAIGNEATCTAANQIKLGNSSVTSCYIGGGATSNYGTDTHGAATYAKSLYLKESGIAYNDGGANTLLTLHGSFDDSPSGNTSVAMDFTQSAEDTDYGAVMSRIACASRSGLLGSGGAGYGTELEFYNLNNGSLVKQMSLQGGDNRRHVIVNSNNDGTGGGFALRVINDGNNANRDGIELTIGADDASGTTAYIDALDGDGGQVGHISNTSGTFALTDVSDKRLKKNIVDTSVKGVETIDKMKVRDFEWIKSGDKTTAGFVAQELAEAFPSAVTGEDGAMEDILDEDGNKTGERIKPMGVSRDVLVPVLIKAVQELSARVKELEGK